MISKTKHIDHRWQLKLIILVILSFPFFKIYAQSYNKYVELGNQEFSKGNFYSAATYFKEASELAPDIFSIKYQLAESLMRANSYNEACLIFTELSNTISQKYPLSSFYSAELLKMQGKYNDAIKQYLSLIHISEPTRR